MDNPTSLYFYAKDSKMQAFGSVLSEIFRTSGEALHMINSADVLPHSFDWDEYYRLLSTAYLGKSIVWADMLNSSWTLAKSVVSRLPPNSGLVIVSSLQKEGKGRGNNEWISPLGQAAFTFHVTVPMNHIGSASNAYLSDYLSCLQHLSSLAVLLTLRQFIATALDLPVYQSAAFDCHAENVLVHLAEMKLPGNQLVLKWPNDLMVKEVIATGEYRLQKICGTIAFSVCKNPQTFNCLIGIGVNVSNRRPTSCLHEVIETAASAIGREPDQVSLPSIEAVIANTLGHLEQLMLLVETEDGLHRAMELYKTCWIHDNQKVKTTDEESGRSTEYTIVGLNSSGFLRVVGKDGVERVLRPGSHSIDMLSNLVLLKP